MSPHILTEREQLCFTCQVEPYCRPKAHDCKFFASIRNRQSHISQKILAYLSQQEKATAKTIRTQLDMAHSTVFNHLLTLTRQDKITRQKAPADNRQVYHYSLKEAPPCNVERN